MDAKITKTRLSRMLSYDWLKIVGTAVGVIIAWILIFQISATRVMQSQRFVVINYSSNLALDDTFNTQFEKTKTDGVLSGDVIEMETLDMVTNPAANEVFMARIQLGEFDAIFLSQEGDKNTLIESNDENAPKEYARTYLESFLSSYSTSLYSLDLEKKNNYFSLLADYLNPYYGGDYKTGELNVQKVEKDFRARAKRMKDKRYKTEAQLQKGVEIDIDRIQKYQKALINFYDYLDKGYISLEKSSHTAVDEYDYSWEDTFAINICPSTTTEEAKTAMAKLVRYQTEDKKVSANDMCICLFKGLEKENAYRFEGLVYAMNLVETALNSK